MTQNYMGLQFVPVIAPAFDLRNFIDIIGQQSVNEADSRKADAVAKFEDVFSATFVDKVGFAYKHLHLTAFYELPIPFEGMLREFSDMHITCEYTGMMVRGYMTASFYNWRKFLEWASNEDRELSVRRFANWIHETCFSKFAFFSHMPRTNLNDKTFMLGAKA